MTKDKAKNQLITIDWARWVDPDDEEEDEKPGMGDFDPSMMQNFGGMGGMEGMGGMGGMDMANMAKMMGGNMGGDSDDEEEEES